MPTRPCNDLIRLSRIVGWTNSCGCTLTTFRFDCLDQFRAIIIGQRHIVASVYRRRPTECRIDPFQLIEDDVPRIFREHGTALLEEIVRGSWRLSFDRCEHLCSKDRKSTRLNSSHY